MKRLLRILFLSALLGFVFLGADAFRMIGGKAGFPFAYNNPLTCGVIPFDGCGYSYDPIFVTLDYLFWLTVAVIVVTTVDFSWNHIISVRHPDKNKKDKHLL